MDYRDVSRVRKSLREEILKCIDSGVCCFICGMALGFDMMAAETVLELRRDDPVIKLVAAIPFRGQELKWSPSQNNRYRSILKDADEVIYVSNYFERGCEMKRNRFMLDNACRAIAYFNGEPHGGTYFTFRTAVERAYTVINLY